MKELIHCEVITPLFSRGAYEDRAEIRVPSIRGQLHWWFRALGGGIEQERSIFGGIARKDMHWKDQASRVMIRVGRIEGQQDKCDTLPHKPEEGKRAPKQAYLPETTFYLHISDRLGGLKELDQKAFIHALQSWLLMGTLGARGTRASGSLIYQVESDLLLPPPPTIDAYKNVCTRLLAGTKLQMAVLSETDKDARNVASDTIGGPFRRDEHNDLAILDWPLGVVSSRKERETHPRLPERKTSPLHLRVYRFDKGDRLVAVWDGRNDRMENLLKVAELMKQKGKPLGELLLNAFIV